MGHEQVICKDCGMEFPEQKTYCPKCNVDRTMVAIKALGVVSLQDNLTLDYYLHNGSKMHNYQISKLLESFENRVVRLKFKTPTLNFLREGKLTKGPKGWAVGDIDIDSFLFWSVGEVASMQVFALQTKKKGVKR